VTENRRGVVLGAGAYLLWGLFPLYWPLLEPATSLEILAHRFVWSLVVVVGLIAVRRRLGGCAGCCGTAAGSGCSSLPRWSSR